MVLRATDVALAFPYECDMLIVSLREKLVALVVKLGMLWNSSIAPFSINM